MKGTIHLILLLAISFFTLCCRQSPPAGLIGKWNIVSDSTFISGNGVLPGSAKNYIGTKSDYYDFTTDGHLYIKKGEEADTATYKTIANQIALKFFYVKSVSFGGQGASRGNYTIAGLTAHTLTLILPKLNTPGGTAGEMVNLSR